MADLSDPLQKGKLVILYRPSGVLSSGTTPTLKNLYRRHLTEEQATAVTTKAFHEQARLNAAQRKRDAGSRGIEGGRGKAKTLASNSTQGFTDRQARSVAGKIASLAKTTNYKARQALKVAKDAPECRGAQSTRPVFGEIARVPIVGILAIGGALACGCDHSRPACFSYPLGKTGSLDWCGQERQGDQRAAGHGTNHTFGLVQSVQICHII